MQQYPGPLQRLIDELRKLPDVGPKKAQRLAFHLLRQPEPAVGDLTDAIVQARTEIRPCSRCFNFSAEELCPICQNSERDHGQVCVVEQAADVIAFERTGEYRGVYHVLQGHLSPLEGITEDQVRIAELIARVKADEVREVILATSPTVEGEATASYIVELLRAHEVEVTTIAIGLPVGGDLDYADQVTIARALQGRTRWHP